MRIMPGDYRCIRKVELTPKEEQEIKKAMLSHDREVVGVTDKSDDFCMTEVTIDSVKDQQNLGVQIEPFNTSIFDLCNELPLPVIQVAQPVSPRHNQSIREQNSLAASLRVSVPSSPKRSNNSFFAMPPENQRQSGVILNETLRMDQPTESKNVTHPG